MPKGFLATKEELEHLEKDSSGLTKVYCISPIILSTFGKRKQKEMYGRTFTKEEGYKYERQFKEVIKCQCGEFMYAEKEDLVLHGKKEGTEDFWICEKCNIKMLDCGNSTEIVRTMLDADIEPTDALSVFDSMQKYHKEKYGHEEESHINLLERKREEERLYKIQQKELDEIIERGAVKAELLAYYKKWNIGT